MSVFLVEVDGTCISFSSKVLDDSVNFGISFTARLYAHQQTHVFSLE